MVSVPFLVFKPAWQQHSKNKYAMKLLQDGSILCFFNLWLSLNPVVAQKQQEFDLPGMFGSGNLHVVNRTIKLVSSAAELTYKFPKIKKKVLFGYP